ncbi:MAG: Ni/Fe hydrogenase subunit alpha [Ruminiclostridium sp.]|nr:Ni/Fe hydrogenase subunit alpha [Ruminiclostridium sp.]
MKKDINIDIHHLTRVEGHGNIKIKVVGGKIEEAKWEVVETPRFFEAMLVGKSYEIVSYITSRICGICSIGHTLASIRATENAFGIKPTAQTKGLRLLLKHSETLQSHVLHLYFLVAPDFLGLKSVVPLIDSNPEIVGIAATLKKLANDMCDVIGGRTIHPLTPVVGGFTKTPTAAELKALKDRIIAAVPLVEKTVEIIKTFKLPDFTRETEFVSLKGENEYPFIGGNLISTDGVNKPEKDYRQKTNEYMVNQSTSKWTELSRKSYAVGALARLNNNYQFLHPKAKEVSELFGLKPVNHNPYMNNIAQLVEVVHVAYEAIAIIDSLINAGLKDEPVKVEVKAGVGVGAVEVPRGILYHEYEYDKNGKIRKSNCIIPTGQNHANIHYDIQELASYYYSQNKSDKEIELLAEMLVRAYDPCISCSVH